MKSLVKALRALQNGVGSLADFLEVFQQYRPQHTRRYAAQIAFGVAFRGLPF